jgi:hypothetical protein
MKGVDGAIGPMGRLGIQLAMGFGGEVQEVHECPMN